MDGIFVDFWGSRIFVDVVFRLFFKRSAQKVENPIEAPQPEIALEGVIPSDMPWTDVEIDVVEVPFLRFIDQSGSFVGRECIGVIVGDECSPQDLFAKGEVLSFGL